MFLHPRGQISLLPGPAPEGIPHRITGSSGEENKLGGEARAKLESEAGILFLFPMTFFFPPMIPTLTIQTSGRCSNFSCVKEQLLGVLIHQ